MATPGRFFERLLLHGGGEMLQIDGIQCVPVERFLRELHPAQSLPFVPLSSATAGP